MQSAQPLKEKVENKFIKLFLGKDAPNWHIYFVIILIYVVPPLFDLTRSLINKQQVNVNQSVQQIIQPSGEQPNIKGTEACKDFPNIGTDISYENMWNNQGIYQPIGLNYKEGTLWINGAVIPKFKSIFIEYQVIEQENTEDPPSFIITLVEPNSGKTNTTVGKFWVPEYSISKNGQNKSLQLIGRAYNGSDRESPIVLQEPTKTNQVDTIEIETLDTNGKESILNFIYTYTSDSSDDAVTKKFTQTITWAVSNPDSSSKLIDIGLGVFKNHKLKIEKIRICE